MVEIVESCWGDWWVVVDGEPHAVHLRDGNGGDPRAHADEQARTIAPDEPVFVRAFRTQAARGW